MRRPHRRAVQLLAALAATATLAAGCGGDDDVFGEYQGGAFF